MAVTLSPARPDDLEPIRDLQIASWQDAYRGLLPDGFLDADVPRILGTRWAKYPGPGWIVTCAREDGRLLGFVTVDRGKGPGAYVDNLHVARAGRGRGIGRRLMADVAAQLAPAGVGRLWLTVIRENSAARGFYRAIGGVEGPQGREELYGQPVVTLPVEWRDLDRLAALGRGR